MSSPRERRGRTASAEGVLAEARVQAFAVRDELTTRDVREWSALEAVDLLLAEGDVLGARRVVRQLRRWDVEENALHREITDVFGADEAVAG